MEVVDLVPRRDAAGVRNLIAHAVGYPTPDKLRRVLFGHSIDPARHLVGFEQTGALVGLLGVKIEPEHATIHQIAVQPQARSQGVGREMVRWLVETAGMTRVVAETDNDAVGFYRRLGFSVVSLGDERYPGTERFECRLDAGAGADLSTSAHGRYYDSQHHERRREHP
jgi:ribosomal protein S18 acetylase RimI-like enzyme